MSNEVAMWRAVIAQAIDDACIVVRPQSERGRRDGMPPSPEQVKLRQKQMRCYMLAAILMRDRARAWLLGNEKDFRDVCELALLEPDAVREQAQALSRRDWVQPSFIQPVRITETMEL